jgi:plasmid stabilization system protein ParE
MGRKVVFHPAADQEIEEAQSWYAARSEFAATAFAHEVDLVVRRVTEAPDRWPESPDGTRRLVFPRFPFTLVYRASGDLIQVVALAHQRRRPGYWRRRLPAS